MENFFEVLTFKHRYLLQNIDWLEEELGGYDDEYLIFDCPGEFGAMDVYVMTQIIDRSNRTLYTPSIPPNACQTASTDRSSNVRDVSSRVTIHGGQVQVLQVHIFVLCVVGLNF